VEPSPRAEEARELLEHVGHRVHEFRSDQKLTLDQLSARSGVSRRMISMLEAGTANASLATIDKLARALRTDFASLVSARRPEPLVPARTDAATTVWRDDLGSDARLLGSSAGAGTTELWQWHLAPSARYQAEADPPGSEELILVQAGSLVVEVEEGDLCMEKDGYLRLPSDRSYAYRNDGDRPCRFLRVVVVP
jgi:transcriptional regulator with XRE-family HTH domain